MLERARLPVSLAALVLALGFQGVPPAGAQEELNRIVLRVNDEILTLYEYERRKADQISAILAAESLDPAERQDRLANVGRLVLGQAFEELLVRSRAEQMGVRIDDARVEAALEDTRVRQGIETREEMVQAIESMGLTLDRVRESLRKELSMQQVMVQEVQSRIDVGEEELRAIYRNEIDRFQVPEERELEEVIVLESSGLDTAERRRVAGEITARLEAGAELADAVAPFQADGTTTGVIELGWLRAEELEPTLAEAAWELELGEHSQPVEGRGGLHVVVLSGLKEAETRPFSEVADEILARERAIRFRRELRSYIGELEEAAFVREDLPPEAVGYRQLIAEEPEADELDLFLAPIGPPKGGGEPPEAGETSEVGTASES